VTTLSLHSISGRCWSKMASRFADLGFEQGFGYAEAAARRIGAATRYCAVYDGVEPVAAAAVRIRTVPGLGRGIAWIAAGPLLRLDARPVPEAADLSEILSVLRAEFCERLGHVLRFRLSGTAFLEPETAAAAARSAGFERAVGTQPYRSSILPLDSDPDTLMARLHGKWRTDLRFALKSGMTLEWGADPALTARFMRLYEPVRRTKGFDPDIPPEFHFALVQPGYDVQTLIATMVGTDLAGIVTGTCGPTTTYLFGATADAGRPLRAGYLLQWQAMALSRETGCRWYDLGGIDEAANPEVARFKNRMGGIPVFVEPYEARPSGLTGRLVPALERLRAKLKGRA
jgi:hypothetical protein